MSNSNDELTRIVTPAVFQHVKRDEINSDDITLALYQHDCDSGPFSYPKGYVLRSKSDLMRHYEGSVHAGCAFVFHRSKGLYPRIVWQQCQAIGIPARLIDEDRVVINPAGSPVNVFDTPVMQARVAGRMGWDLQANKWIDGWQPRPMGVKVE